MRLLSAVFLTIMIISWESLCQADDQEFECPNVPYGEIYTRKLDGKIHYVMIRETHMIDLGIKKNLVKSEDTQCIFDTANTGDMVWLCGETYELADRLPWWFAFKDNKFVCVDRHTHKPIIKKKQK